MGLTLNEFLDFNVTAKMVSQAASRTLGLLIAKYKILGGMPFDVAGKVYDAMVWPVIAYGAFLGGDRSKSCTEAVQNRAMRFFVSRYTPSAGVAGDMCWIPPLIRQWKTVCNFWSRYFILPNSRVNKRIFMYAYRCGRSRCKNWHFRIKAHLNTINFPVFANVDQPINKRNMIKHVTDSMESISNSRCLKLSTVIGV